MRVRKEVRAVQSVAKRDRGYFQGDIHLRDVEGVLSEKAKKKGVEA